MQSKMTTCAIQQSLELYSNENDKLQLSDHKNNTNQKKPDREEQIPWFTYIKNKNKLIHAFESPDSGSPWGHGSNREGTGGGIANV